MVVTQTHADPKVRQAVMQLALEGFEKPGEMGFASREKYAWLRENGSRLWLDTGDAVAAENAWSAETEALTTNNTLVNQVVQTGALDGTITWAARKMREIVPDISDQDLIIELAFLANAKLALDLVMKFGAHVSVELHPDLGDDIEGILTFARRYYEICPDFFYIKVPLTPDGFVAVRRLSEEGIPVNFTLGFSARQNYLATRFSRPAFVNVFLGRLNQVVEENQLGDPANVGEKATLASDELVKNIRASTPDTRTHQIGASLRNGRQVAALAGVDVLTIPPKAAEDYLSLDITKADLAPRNWRDLDVAVDPHRFGVLWDVNEPYVRFVDDVLRKADLIETGLQLTEVARANGVKLFHDWTPEDRARIREKGKIPDLAQWPDAPLDDLMSISALESFAADQVKLDERIRGLLE
jgi:transaldolase